VSKPVFRPPWYAVALAALFAGFTVWSFAQGKLDEEWISFWGLFLVLEVTAAISAQPGDTMSERLWNWIGIRPPRPVRLWRVPAVVVFVAILLGHFAQGGTLWWTSGGAVIVTSLPVAAAVLLGFRENRKGIS